MVISEHCDSPLWRDYNVLDYDERILDGFYDVYASSSDSRFKEKLPSLAELEQTPMPHNLDYEVVLVNRAIDPALNEIEQIALCSLDTGPAEPGLVNRSLAKRIAEIVADHMGGPVSNANDMLARWTITSYELRASSNNIILLLGCMKIGLSRHRALLFKVLADLVGIPCRLVKGSHYTGIDGGAINIIKLDEGEFIVDLMGAPGSLIPVETPSTAPPQMAKMDSFILDQRISAQVAQDLWPQDKNNLYAVENTAPQMNINSEQKFQDILLDENAVGAAPPFLSETNPYQYAGEKKAMQRNKVSEIRNTEFYRRRENIFSGPGRSPLPIMQKNPFMMNNIFGENPRIDLLDGLSVGRKPEVRGYNLSTMAESSSSQSPHVAYSGITNLTNNHNSTIQSPSGALVHSGMNKDLLDTPVAVTGATGGAVASFVVAPANRCSESPVDDAIAIAMNNFLPSFQQNEKHMEPTNCFAWDIGDKKDNYAKRKVKETSEYERKIYDKHGHPQHANDRLAYRSGNSEDEQNPSHSNSIHRPRLDAVLDDVAEWEIPWEDLVIGERIGLGSYGEVYHADWNGTEVAVKKFLDQDFSGDALEEFRSEVRIMRRLRHPNVVLFMGAVTRPPNLSIVTEFLPRGSLYRLIHRPNIQIEEKRRIRMALDVAKGMNCLHSSTPTIVHRDLKSPNLLVDKNWAVKVCDFGLSRMKHNTFLSSKSTAGTPEWMAPEVLRNEPSNEKCDVYSFGVILWELATLRMPWSGMNPMQVVGAVGFQNRRLDIPKELDPLVSRIIWQCWQNEPSLRPSFSELMVALKPLQRLVIPPQSDNRAVLSQDYTVNTRHQP
ncbi:serine/threonine-protein kinase EDR1 isoform X2 [Cryptomeria japonica]|uniref:serine/threonine-protein kinase EDR1 isoform X2 n=1 Tax=Cryptomeria japonica TaxID=3369 RepID=UPI0025AC1BC5|nr:serine/threonine-protein kinase EDR1 isoform X2 [Cryptomeria japonica]